MGTLLVTGGAGFIGSSYVLGKLARSDGDRIVVLDDLTYAGNLENLKPVESHPRFRFVKGSITDEALVEKIFGEESPTAAVHFAAESHVDRSILGPKAFVETNIVGTQVLLQASKRHQLGRFLMVSTDEVYGSLGASGTFSETSPLAPTSPYSASKASADLMALAYHHTFGLDVVVTRCSNNYGPLQFPEKLIPLMIINALNDQALPVYGDGMQVRDWIHVDDHCRALDLVLQGGRAGQVYNIGAKNERPNLEIVETILRHLNKPHSLIRHVEDRPGHDRRYAINPNKIYEELGFAAEIDLTEGLAATVDWYVSHQDWWRRVQTGAYREYYQEQYGQRLRGDARSDED